MCMNKGCESVEKAQLTKLGGRRAQRPPWDLKGKEDIAIGPEAGRESEKWVFRRRNNVCKGLEKKEDTAISRTNTAGAQ